MGGTYCDLCGHWYDTTVCSCGGIRDVNYVPEPSSNKMSDIDIIKRILLKLFVVNNEIVFIDPLLFMDRELKELLKQLKGK